MSLNVIFLNNKNLITASDSRSNIEIDGEPYVLSDNVSKTCVIDNKLIFCCGDILLIKSILKDYTDVYGLANAAKEKWNPQYSALNMTISCFEEIPTVYSISSEDGFEIHKHTCNESNYNIITAGFDADKALPYIQERGGKMPLNELLVSTYEHLASERIGGHIDVYKLDSQKLTLTKQEVRDRYEVKRVTEHHTGGTVQTGTIGARIVMKDNSMKFYDSNGDLSMEFPKMTGNLTYRIVFYNAGNEWGRIETTVGNDIAFIGPPVTSGTRTGIFMNDNGVMTFEGNSTTGLGTDTEATHAHTITIGTANYTTSFAGLHDHNVDTIF